MFVRQPRSGWSQFLLVGSTPDHYGIARLRRSHAACHRPVSYVTPPAAGPCPRVVSPQQLLEIPESTKIVVAVATTGLMKDARIISPPTVTCNDVNDGVRPDKRVVTFFVVLTLGDSLGHLLREPLKYSIRFLSRR